MNILIVDDSKMVRHMAITALHELGYDGITEASDVGEAKNLLKGKKFDLIISDWHMPGESGLDFLKYVKSCPEYAALPFVLQTTENEKKNIVEAVKAGVSGYLFKPVQKSALGQKLLELSTVYKFQPPSMTLPSIPVAVGKIAPDSAIGAESGISARSLPDFASALTQRDFGFSCEVKTGASAPLLVCIGNDVYGQFSKTFHERYSGASCVFICDSQTDGTFGEITAKIEKETESFKITIPDIDKNSTIAQCGAIMDAMAEKQLDASSVIIAMGTASLLSLAGFIAATYRGGIRFAAIPLALSDFLTSSVETTWVIGGSQCERLAWLHYNPSMLWFDVSAFAGLPSKEYSYSCAEIFRYAFFGGTELMESVTEKWEKLLAKDVTAIAECSRLCIAARASLRAQNIDGVSREAALQFAQSLAGALVESCLKTALHPGQAIYRAVACLCEAAKRSGTLTPASFKAYITLLQKMPSFSMPEALSAADVFQKAYGPLSLDLSREVVALPGPAGSVITTKPIVEEVFMEALKSLLTPSGGSTEKIKKT